MNIVHDAPPNFNEIVAAFPQAAGKGVVFTWGGTIYVPKPDGALPAWTVDHERVHSQRQSADWKAIEAWWKRYIADPEYRLAEEIPAHRAEFRMYCRAQRDRNQQSAMLTKMAKRLSGALYGSLIPLGRAKAEIQR